MLRQAIGIDIGGTNLRAARVDAEGRILARAKAPSAADPALVTERLAELISSVDGPAVAAIGIGVPGRVDARRRAVLSGGYVDLSGVDLAGVMETRFGRPVTIENDCGMALVAEAAVGAARGRREVAMLTIGTGIGGAILSEGRLLRGRATAGQLGHLVVVPEGRACLCGRRGCVETESSGTALGRHIAEAGLPTGTTAASLLDARRRGDETAARVLAAWGRPLRAAIDSLVATLDPELVLLGGGLGREAAEAISALPSASDWYACPVEAAALGDDAGAIGAALAALRNRGGEKRVVLVNGIPASGKSTVSRALSEATGWPLLALDTVKNPFLKHIGTVDRPFNRVLGQASYEAIFDLIREAPAGATAIVDAWFGFQPREVLLDHLARAGVADVAEVWCHAPPETVGARYAARLGSRLPGHPGAEYVPELIALAARAEPLRLGRPVEIDTTKPANAAAVLASLAFAPAVQPDFALA